jgi:hypothetical protein
MLLPQPLVLLSTLALVSSAAFAAPSPSPSVVDEVAALLKGSSTGQQDATTLQQASSNNGAEAKFWGRPAVGRR